jgi:hypothetical protein
MLELAWNQTFLKKLDRNKTKRVYLINYLTRTKEIIIYQEDMDQTLTSLKIGLAILKI